MGILTNSEKHDNRRKVGTEKRNKEFYLWLIHVANTRIKKVHTKKIQRSTDFIRVFLSLGGTTIQTYANPLLGS